MTEPTAEPISAAERSRAAASRTGESGRSVPGPTARTLVVLDDDPTGTQSVAGLPVLTRWRVDDLGWAMRTGAPAVYVLTNTRSLDASDAERVNEEVVRAAVEAGREQGVSVGFVSRGDSTLRGHFPLEPNTICRVLDELGEPQPRGIVLLPAFPEAGRVTVGGVHYVRVGGRRVPVGESEFARDATFGFRSSRLRDWVEEVSGGAIPAHSVAKLELPLISAGSESIAAWLESVPQGAVIAVDAESNDDLRAAARGFALAEQRGMGYVFRVGPPFVRALISQEPGATVDTAALRSSGRAGGGLIVVGSHVEVTTRQLARLVEERPDICRVEVPVREILDPARRDEAVAVLASRVVHGLETGDVVLATTREVVHGVDEDASLGLARSVSRAVVEIVRGVLADRLPKFVVAKGGITSSDVATAGMGISRAWVRGSLLPGMVSLWEPLDGAGVGVPYVVFAGNVGDDDALAEVVDRLSVVGTALPDRPEQVVEEYR